MAKNRTLKGIYGEAGAAYVTHGNTITGEFCAVTSLHDTTNITLTWSELNKDIHKKGNIKLNLNKFRIKQNKQFTLFCRN